MGLDAISKSLCKGLKSVDNFLETVDRSDKTVDKSLRTVDSFCRRCSRMHDYLSSSITKKGSVATSDDRRTRKDNVHP